MNIDNIKTNYILTKSVYGNYRLVLYFEEYDSFYQNSIDREKYNDLSIDDIPDKEIINSRNYEKESKTRSKNTILDLALNNAFKWFVTFTFDPKKIARNDIATCKQKFLKAINNYNLKFDVKLQYIAVPEWHAKHDAIHFHCLMNNLDDLEYSHLDKKTGHKIFVSNFFLKRFGAVQAIRIFDYNKFVSYYISKYVSKQEMDTFYRRYFRSNKLERSFEIRRGISTELANIPLIPMIDNQFITVYEFDNMDVLQNLVNGGSHETNS